MLQYDSVFDAMNRNQVRAVLIGGLNFFLRYQPVSTRDIDLFVEDSVTNLSRCEQTLAELNASWGVVDEDWGLVRDKPAGWLGRQSVHCLLCDAGELDIFTRVAGLESFEKVFKDSEQCQTVHGTAYRSLSRKHMIDCQLAIPESMRRLDRIKYLRSLEDSGDE